MKNLYKKVTYNKIAVVLLAVFIIYILPIVYCSFFNYANGDDLWEGAVAHQVLVNGGNIKEFISAVYQWAKVDYLGWEGNWSSIILWCLEPSIWGEGVYRITAWIAFAAICGSSTYFLQYYLKKYLTADFVYSAIIILITNFFLIQYMPNLKSGIFWYTGMINYIVPLGLVLSSFVWMDKFLEDGKKRYLILISIVYTYASGAGYTPIVLAFEVLFLVIIWNLLGREKIRKRRGAWLFLPFVLLLAGFIFSAASPGNAVRGGEEYYLGGAKAFWTILESIKQGFLAVPAWFLQVRPLILAVPFLCVITWELIDVSKIKINLKYPAGVILLLFLISCSLYAPGIYARSEVSGGVPDTIYFVFYFTLVIGVLYLTCYLKKWYEKKGGKQLSAERIEKVRAALVLAEIIVCVIAGNFLTGNMSAHICMEFIESGQLEDYEFQMQERLAILQDPNVKEVVLPEMNDQQGPFMHMPIIGDPKAYTNYATQRFYGKDSVIAIPREEYYELYGYPEERQ